MMEQLDFPSGCLALDKLGLFGRAQLALRHSEEIPGAVLKSNTYLRMLL